MKEHSSVCILTLILRQPVYSILIYITFNCQLMFVTEFDK